MSSIHLDQGWFKDEHNRRLILRGVNLGGSSKVPYTPDGATFRRDNFFDHRNVAFIGRPFPLEEAEEHFSRLRAWGLNFLRFLTTWEAVEHAGPGIYDEAYLDYLYAVVKKAGDYGIDLFIDPHQDVWSRFSGGDGAPGWTLEAAGLDMTHFDETGAAITHAIHGDPFPRMIWPTNNYKLAAATMYTLFFAGNDFAPQTLVEGQPVQEFLQSHYIAAMQQVAERLKGLSNVVGYDTLNEPALGYIGIPDLNTNPGPLRIGDYPTYYQSMLLGSGLPQEVGVWKFAIPAPRQTGTRILNPDGVSAWLPGCACIWKQHGVWAVNAKGEPVLLKPDYFHKLNGKEVDFNRDYFRPFANRFAAAIREIDPQSLIFVETAPEYPLPVWQPGDVENIVSAAHWYDVMTLLSKKLYSWLGIDIHTQKLVVGKGAVRKSFARQIEHWKHKSFEQMQGAPVIIGETGIPFDLQMKRAYQTGDFSTAVKAMNRTMTAMDDTLVSYTIWNYTADNTNARGDMWNDEDLSIFSRNQQSNPEDIYSGGRALEAVVRPYTKATAGLPLRMSFDINKKVFEFEFQHEEDISAPTEFFIPNFQYPRGYEVAVSDGRFEKDEMAQSLRYYHTLERQTHWVKVTSVR
ncbi:MAG: cellulase family glycosylhydrolase [Anaerolineales bacterium]|nr:cellulase family glycosylhydrolase [Anaerolineales bacterium]